MSEENLYAAPKAELALAEEVATELASRGQRFGAAMLDTLIALLLLMPAMWYSGYFDSLEQGVDPKQQLL